MTADMKTARIKFCGGCNPEYDRVAAAGRIRRHLEAAGYRVETGSGKGDLAVVVCGCACACADVSGLKCDRMITVTGEEEEAKSYLYSV